MKKYKLKEIYAILPHIGKMSSYKISAITGIPPRSVRYWRKRFQEGFGNDLPVIAVKHPDRCYIALSSRKYPGRFAIISPEDFDLVIPRWWHPVPGKDTHTWYASAGHGKNTITMHRLILPVQQGLTVDHIDGNGLNNLRSNLRMATQQQQRYNTGALKGKQSRYIGVRWFPKLRKWGARIQGTHLGCFTDETEAARVRDKAARERFGEYARLNLPDET